MHGAFNALGSSDLFRVRCKSDHLATMLLVLAGVCWCVAYVYNAF